MNTVPPRKWPILIGGELVETAQTRTVCLPFDGSPAGEIFEADAGVFEQAVRAAQLGGRAMAEMSNGERAELLLRILALVRRDLADFARLIALETGKPIKEARAESERALITLAESAAVARDLHGEAIPMDAFPPGRGRMGITVREPLGIVGAITPFNFPFNLAMHKIAPALAGGNAVVHKPSEQAPLSAARFGQTVREAGAPAGAYNLIPGDGETAGQWLVRDPRVAMITFTGSVPVGKAIRAAAGLKKVTLELGGNAALILEPDADLPTAVQRAASASYSLSGQSCISVQRIYAHESIATDFLDRLKSAAERLRIGHPLEETTDVSSLISELAAERVAAWIDEAVKAGARIVTGGTRKGATIQPTILTGVPTSARVSREEVFGPVVAVNRYRNLDDAIARVNDTNYGLQAGIFTQDIQRAFRAARRLQVGGVMINDVPTWRVDNMPYGGTKESGIGREGPRYAVEEMTDLKLIAWKL